jgi:TIR domain
MNAARKTLARFEPSGTYKPDIDKGARTRSQGMDGWVSLVPQLRRTRFFVSYRSLEEAAARALERRLKARGHEVWRDRSSLHTGDDWQAEIARAIHDCDDVLVLLTREAALSPQVRHEIACANELDKRLHCFTTIDVRRDSTLYALVERVNIERIPDNLARQVVTSPDEFALAVTDRLFGYLHQQHPLPLRDFERAAARGLYPPFTELYKAGELHRPLLERYHRYAMEVGSQRSRRNASIALNAGLLAAHLGRWNESLSCLAAAHDLGAGTIAHHYRAVALLAGTRPRHASPSALDLAIEHATAALRAHRSPLTAMLLVSLWWDSGRGVGPKAQALFVEALQALPSAEPQRGEIARFMHFASAWSGLQLPIDSSNCWAYLRQLSEART